MSKLPTIVPVQDEEGGIISSSSALHVSHGVNLSGDTWKNDVEAIRGYRDVALQPEVDSAIQDILNQAITYDESGNVVDLVLDRTNLSENVKKKIYDEFKRVLNLFNFGKKAQEYFRNWYVDGRIYFHLVVDQKNIGQGIQRIQFIDPTMIRKVTEVDKVKDPKSQLEYDKVVGQYYAISTSGHNNSDTAVKIDPSVVVFAGSGLSHNGKLISHLRKAMKPMNNLRMLEDSLVIYRIARAPERRIFYIDTGNLNKVKSDEYVQSIRDRYRNKMVYDVNTGDLKDDRNTVSMLEDFWLPRREGGRGTEITTLPGGESLGQIDDVIFFQKKLYKSLNVPVGRLEQDATFSLGRSTEITRDEVKFQRFIDSLRSKFSSAIVDTLGRQLMLKGIMNTSEWDDIKNDIFINFSEDSHFTEMKELEILRERTEVLAALGEYVGKYYSHDWIRRNILRMNDDEIRKMQKEIDKEKASGEITDEDELGIGDEPKTPNNFGNSNKQEPKKDNSNEDSDE